MSCGLSEEVELGEGGYGLIKLVRRGNENLILKVIKKDDLSLAELDIHSSLKHPHLMPGELILSDDCGSIINSDEYGILMPVAQLSLHRYIERHSKTLDMKECMLDIASALYFLHTQGYAHFDIKENNVMIRRGKCILIDYGLAIYMPEDETFSVYPGGTPGYMAPEIVNRSCSMKSDIWSLGIVFLSMIRGELVTQYFMEQGWDGKDDLSKWITPQFIRDSCGVGDFPPDILSSMLEPDPDRRINSEELVDKLNAFIPGDRKIPPDVPTTVDLENELPDVSYLGVIAQSVADRMMNVFTTSSRSDNLYWIDSLLKRWNWIAKSKTKPRFNRRHTDEHLRIMKALDGNISGAIGDERNQIYPQTH